MSRSPKRFPRPAIAVLAMLALAVTALGGCGSEGSSSSSTEDSADSGVVKASGADFPGTRHRSLRMFVSGMQQGPALAPSVSALDTGKNRFGFGLFDQGNKQIGDLEVALYYARSPNDTTHGPYPASFKPIEVKPAYQSKTAADDPDSAKTIYVADLPFKSPGTYLVLGVMQLNGQLVASQPARVKVTANSRLPGRGDAAISVHTPTKADVGGQLSRIDTRNPHDDMHDVDLADALKEHKPTVLLFATPALCQSRVCGPVTDVAEQVHNDFGDKVAFIHQEIYADNNPSKGYTKPVDAWHLRSEPFLFVIDSQGKVTDRLEGAFTAGELKDAVQKALKQ